MIEILKFIEELELLHKMLTVEPKDDDPAKIITRGKIRELISKYKQQEEEFDKWAEAESQRETLPEGGTVVSPSSEKANLVHPGAFPGAKSE